MKKTVVLLDKIPKDQLIRLEEAFEVIPYYSQLTPETVTKALNRADGIVGSHFGIPIDETFLAKTPNLKAATTISAGFDNYDLSALNLRGIRLMNTPNAVTQATADLIFTLLMATARRTVELSKMIDEGKWTKWVTPQYYGSDIYGKTIGILGMGRIGKAIAKRAHCGFDMNVIYYNRSAQPDAENLFNAKRLALDEVLKQADFVVIILPLSGETDQLITKQKLALMKPSAILINGARGRIVNQADLVDALQNKIITAAGLDVFEVEPLPMDSPLLKLDNVILSPHVGASTGATTYAMAKTAVDNIINALKTEKPTENWVNPEVG